VKLWAGSLFVYLNTMRDIYQVLYRKEQQLERLRKEVEVLKTVIPLLRDDTEPMMPAANGLTVIPFERAVRSAAPHLPSAIRD
jgi:hypothetical protein